VKKLDGVEKCIYRITDFPELTRATSPFSQERRLEKKWELLKILVSVQ
jgi:hypothetical protein